MPPSREREAERQRKKDREEAEGIILIKQWLIQ